MSTVFVNPERCIGCLQCELACAVEHSAVEGGGSRPSARSPAPAASASTSRPGRFRRYAFPNRCRHCDPAPCLAVCPTGAITRDEEHGVVLVEAAALHRLRDVRGRLPLRRGHLPSAGGRAGTRGRGGGQVRRLRRPAPPGRGTPRAVEVCKVDALVFGELNDLVAAGRVRGDGRADRRFGATPTERPGGDPLAGWHELGRGRPGPPRTRTAAAPADAAGPRMRGPTGKGGSRDRAGGQR